jgi:hypothetical protein
MVSTMVVVVVVVCEGDEESETNVPPSMPFFAL